MSEQYQKGTFVVKYLESLGVDTRTVIEAVSDENYRKSYQVITENPNITKEEFLKIMNLEEEEE